MSYLVLARKYRPQKFSEIIGQEHITQTLKNAIRMGKISHSYLFSGPRGIGKTTTARILAKAVNCKNLDGQEPCNECDSCREITSGEAVDIIEIDAASNRGIGEIRELRENVKFAPSSTKYKFYIIDEVHMLTKEAFNALLKTLEEPPDHVIFVMATTEPDKVLDTIISRCQTFNFRLLSEKEIKDALQDIAEKEDAPYEENGLWQIARAAKGSMRDAQSIMDQVLSFSGGKVPAKDVADILGLIPRNFLFSYTEYIKSKDIKSALELTEKLLKDGYNLNRLFNDLFKHFRNLMFAKVFGESTSFMGFDEEYSRRLAKMSDKFSKEQLTWITEFMNKNTQRIKYSDNPQIVMDTVIFKLCQKYVSFDDIMEYMNSGKNISVQSGKKVKPVKKSKKPVKKPEKTVKKTEIDSGPPPQAPQESQSFSKKFTPSSDIKKPSKSGKWSKILSLIKKNSQPLFHTLKNADVGLKKDKKKVIVRYKSLLELNQSKKEILKNAVDKIMGSDYMVDVHRSKEVFKNKKKRKKNSSKKRKKNRVNPSKIEQEEPVVGKIVDMFNGKIEK
ncbi:MAG: DNA polymerase III subunit gamma/tau [Elusimicrobiota bacterium]